MRPYIWVAAVVCLAVVDCRSLIKRDVDSEAIDPAIQEVDSNDQFRDKRKVEESFGIKNAVLGFVFNKINSFIDQKTAWVSQLDKTNVAKNRAHGIEPPKDPVISLSNIISGVIGQKLQAASPLITVVTNKLSSGSSSGGHTGFNIGSLLGGLSGGASGGIGAEAHVGAGHAGAGVSAYGGV